MTSVSLQGKGSLSPFGKERIARAGYAKGKAFLRAAFLLKNQAQSAQFECVSLHLLSQGVEIILKSLLLLKDYSKYRPQLKRFGHNLQRTADATCKAYGARPLNQELVAELSALSDAYVPGDLRYPSINDILGGLNGIDYQRTLRKMVAVMRLTDRHLRRSD